MPSEPLHPALYQARPERFTEGLTVNPDQGQYNSTYHQQSSSPAIERRARVRARSAGERRYMIKHAKDYLPWANIPKTN